MAFSITGLIFFLNFTLPGADRHQIEIWVAAGRLFNYNRPE